MLRELLQRDVLSRGHRIDWVEYHLARHGRKDADFSTTAIHGIDAAAFLAGSELSSFTKMRLPN